MAASVRMNPLLEKVLGPADASLVGMAADSGVTTVMTTDVRDFSHYRLPDGRGFEPL